MIESTGEFFLFLFFDTMWPGNVDDGFAFERGGKFDVWEANWSLPELSVFWLALPPAARLPLRLHGKADSDEPILDINSG